MLRSRVAIVAVTLAALTLAACWFALYASIALLGQVDDGTVISYEIGGWSNLEAIGLAVACSDEVPQSQPVEVVEDRRLVLLAVRERLPEEATTSLTAFIDPAVRRGAIRASRPR